MRHSATFHRGNTTIDFILCSPDLRHHITQPKITCVSDTHTDHNAVSIKVTTGVAKSGPGLWRFNPSLMKSEYIRNEITTWLDIACRHLTHTSVQEQWDWLKLHLRAFCEALSCKAASHRQRQLQYLKKEYRMLSTGRRQQMDDANLQARLANIWHDISRIQEDDADIQILRAGIRWRDRGERSNAYFYKCLKERQAKQYIHALQTDDGSMVTNPHDMSRCAQAFYSSLYQAENIDHTALHELLTSIPSNVCLDDDDGQLLLARLVMSLAQKYKLPGAALLLDQEKAYDRVHPEYLQAVLHRFGFPTPLINSSIHLFFNTQLCININGYISSPCHQQRGLRPGDPLSPLLFNLMLEPLLRSILSTPAIQGFSFDIPGSPMHRNQFATTLPPLKTLAYADDVLIFVTDKDEVQEIMTIIQRYCRASNAKLNCHKTLAVSLNGHIPDDWKQAFASHDLIHWHDRSCNEAATYLGFPLNSTADQLDQFLQLLLEKVKAHVNILKSRSLSIRGKALTANSLILSRLWYCLRILPSTQQFLNQITSIIIQYLQGKTLPKVSFMTCCRPKTEGGLGILHPIYHLLSLQLRWILPLISLHHAYPDSSLADPYLRVCIQSFCNTLSPVIPILFPERRLNSISSFGHFKTLFEACDKLQLQVNWNQATHHTVLEFPLTSIDTFTGDATDAPSPTWRSLLVRDAYFLSTQARILRGRTDRERRSHRYNLRRFFKATAPNGLWRINTSFLSLLDTGPSTPIPLNITSDYCNVGSPITRSGLTVDNFKRKEFRYSFLTPFHALPSDYPRATSGAWHRFWNSALIPHRATTVIWRLVHHRISSRERLHRIIPAICQSNACLLCEGNVDAVIDTTETDKHFFYACPHVQEVWRVLATRFSLSSLVQWDHIYTLSRTPPQPTADTRITGTTIIACGVLAIWKAHWQFIYNDERFQAQAVANKAAATIHQIEQECNLIARDV